MDMLLTEIDLMSTPWPVNVPIGVVLFTGFGLMSAPWAVNVLSSWAGHVLSPQQNAG
jgi:hypothetical protein